MTSGDEKAVINDAVRAAIDSAIERGWRHLEGPGGICLLSPSHRRHATAWVKRPGDRGDFSATFIQAVHTTDDLAKRGDHVTMETFVRFLNEE